MDGLRKATKREKPVTLFIVVTASVVVSSQLKSIADYTVYSIISY